MKQRKIIIRLPRASHAFKYKCETEGDVNWYTLQCTGKLFCTVKGMVVESEVLKAQSCALNKLSLPMHSNVV